MKDWFLLGLDLSLEPTILEQSEGRLQGNRDTGERDAVESQKQSSTADSDRCWEDQMPTEIWTPDILMRSTQGPWY